MHFSIEDTRNSSGFRCLGRTYESTRLRHAVDLKQKKHGAWIIRAAPKMKEIQPGCTMGFRMGAEYKLPPCKIDKSVAA